MCRQHPLHTKMYRIIFSTVILICLHFMVLIKPEEVVLGTAIQCNEPAVDQTCGPCLAASERRPLPMTAEEKFFNYMAFNHIVMNESDRSGSHSWTFDLDVVENPDNITVSLNMWDFENGKIGQPIPGCCNVPLTSKSCAAADCVEGVVFASIAYEDLTVIGPKEVVSFPRCKLKRVTSRYFNICVHEPTDWARQFNCDCVVYDSVTGEMRPGNHSSGLWGNVTDVGVWSKEDKMKILDPPFEVCQFDMKKENVMKRGTLANHSLAMESALFKRGVYDMDGFKWFNGSVIDIDLGMTINCTSRKLAGSKLFNLSSPMPHNDTFTCLVLWPNGTTDYAPLGTHVKCMPQNVTFGIPSTLYVMPQIDIRTMIIPACGSAVLLVLIILLLFHWRKKLRRFVEETKVVPEELDSVMQDKLPSESPRDLQLEKEDAHAYDKEEKERVSLRKNQEPHQSQRLEMESSATNDDLPHETSAFSHNPEAIISDGYRTKDFQRMVVCSDDAVVFSNGSHRIDIDEPTSGFNNTSNASGGSNTVVNPNDSGCPKSIENHENFEISVAGHVNNSPGKSNFVQNTSFSSRSDGLFVRYSNQDNLNKQFPCRGIPESNGGYWSKEIFCDSSSINRLSQTSNDTGCGTDSDPDCDDSIVDGVSSDIGKHPFLKTTSKDSGVSTENIYLRSMEEDSDEESDHVVIATPHSSPRSFIVNNSRIVECV